MRLSTVYIAVCAILMVGGVGERTRRNAGISFSGAAVFLVSLLVLRGFETEPIEGIFITPACAAALAAPVILAVKRRPWCAAVLPFAAAYSAAVAAIPQAAEQIPPYLVAAACVPLGALCPLEAGLVFSASAPVFASAAASLREALSSGMFGLELGEQTLALQVLCLLLTVMSAAAWSPFGSKKRLLYGRTAY